VGRLEGKVSIVTGAARGIGQAIAELFSREGSTVVLVDIDPTGTKVSGQIEKQGGIASFIQADVSKASDVKNVIRKTIDQCRKIDVLINNAGITGGMADGLEVEDELWQKVLDVDLTGVFLCTKYAANEMIKSGGGSIVNMSSMLGIVGSLHSTPYHAAKGGIRTFTKAMAIVLAPHGIRVNSIHPGYIETDMVRQVFEDLGDPNARKNAESLHPLGRLGKPVEVAYAALFLACEESSFVTGAELVIDGGFTAQ